MNATDLKVVAKLVFAHMRHRPARMLLTLFSTVAAACIVVWVVSSYDSLIAKFDEFSENYLGRYTFVVLPVPKPGTQGQGGGEMFGPPAARLSPDVIETLRQDPAVAVIDPILQARARVTKFGAPPEERGGNRDRGGIRPPIERGNADDDAAQAGVPNIPNPANTPSSPGGVDPPGGVHSFPDFGGRVNFVQGGGGGLNRAPMLVGTNAVEAPYSVTEGNWADPQKPDAMEAAISSRAAEQLKVKLGDEVEVGVGMRSEPVKLKIVGIVEQRKPLPSTPAIIGLPAMRGPPLTRGPASAALYVPLPLAERIAGTSGKYDLAGIALKNGFKVEEFKQNWMPRLTQAGSVAELVSLADVDSELQDSTTNETVKSQAYAATGISLLAALFIIFSTLSMGVDERIRQFAMLRAISFTKAQVATMILLESLFLGLIGWGGGLLAGWGLLEFITKMRPDLFPVGASLGTWCIAMSGLCSVGGALLAAIPPAWKATRVSPLDAMGPQSPVPVTRLSWIATVVGLVLVSVNPILVFWVPMPDTSRYIISAAFGCTCLGVGIIFLAPVTILITEKLLGPIIARLFGLSPKLLERQLSTNLWRTLGTTVALTLGLGLFVAMQTWGYTMLGPYTPGDWVPDMVVVMTPSGIPDSAVDAVRHMKGVIPERSLPCLSEQVKFATDVTGAKVRATSSRQDNCVLVGIDPDLGLGGKKPIFNFKFVSGTRDEAIAKLKQGRYCLVPDHFERESGLTVGGKFGVLHPDDPKQVLEYEIAGVVSMTGWHWMSKVGLRNRGGGRSSGLMFTAFDQVRKDVGTQRINAFWINTDGTVKEEDVKASLQAITEKNHDPSLARGRGPGMGMGGFGMGMGGGGFGRGGRGNGSGYSTTVNIRSREGVQIAIRERANGIIWLLSRLPLVTLLVTSLGVINTIVSSIRARRWEMGVMRAIGITRFGLFRMILCEAILVGVAACLLSFAFGVTAGYCGTGITRYVNVRGGQITPLIVPWMQIGVGFLMTLILCLIAALWPAMQTGRTEPLRLLQSGRTAA
ncbi:MAG: macB 7 [Planctomycetaceae bacterium]|nr:macB 7 [Planctomycetaceae bacterium]